MASNSITNLEECKNWCSENSFCKVIYFSNEYRICLWHDNVIGYNGSSNATVEFDEYVKQSCPEDSTTGNVPEGNYS